MINILLLYNQSQTVLLLVASSEEKERPTYAFILQTLKISLISHLMILFLGFHMKVSLFLPSTRNLLFHISFLKSQTTHTSYFWVKGSVISSSLWRTWHQKHGYFLWPTMKYLCGFEQWWICSKWWQQLDRNSNKTTRSENFCFDSNKTTRGSED